MRLENKVALITGAASGIGEAAALLFAKEGAVVSVVDIDATRGKKVTMEIQETGGTASYIEGDVSTSSGAKHIISSHLERHAGLDILFNNAGISPEGTVLTTTEEEWDRVIDVNLKSVYLLSKEAIPFLAMRRGVIVNTASGWGLDAAPNFAAYCASKAGVILLTKSMAVDHAGLGIRVNCICPGPILTSLLRDNPPEELERRANLLPLKRLGRPEDVARVALFLASDESAFMTGSAVVVDGGMLAKF